MRLAAIDIGTNASRLLISEVTVNGDGLASFNKLNLIRVPLRLGFDVFDDIIDHTYDTEYRPYHRLELVAKEVERVYNKYSIEDMRNLLTEKWDRLDGFDFLCRRQ